jgi:chemotaxis response regulator CheB
MERRASTPPTVNVLLGGMGPWQTEILSEMLASAGPVDVVGSASDGHETIDAVEGLAPDIVLLNFRLAGMSGLETARQLQRREPGCRVILVGDEQSDEYRAAAGAAGAAAYLPWLDLHLTLPPILSRLAISHPPIASRAASVVAIASPAERSKP